MVSLTAYDRLVHSYGKSYPDMARMYLRHAPNAPDGVAFPKTEQDIQAIYQYAAENKVAVIPFGGGTSVCGGVEADVGDHYHATLSVDMQNFNQVLQVDPISRRARIRRHTRPCYGGRTKTARPDPAPLSAELSLCHPRRHDRDRAGGHFATVYTHIEDMLEATRTVTPVV